MPQVTKSSEPNAPPDAPRSRITLDRKPALRVTWYGSGGCKADRDIFGTGLRCENHDPMSFRHCTVGWAKSCVLMEIVITDNLSPSFSDEFPWMLYTAQIKEKHVGDIRKQLQMM